MPAMHWQSTQKIILFLKEICNFAACKERWLIFLTFMTDIGCLKGSNCTNSVKSGEQQWSRMADTPKHFDDPLYLKFIYLSVLRCAYHAAALGKAETKDLKCTSPVMGRYVYVALRVQEELTLCEVEVYAVKERT